MNTNELIGALHTSLNPTVKIVTIGSEGTSWTLTPSTIAGVSAELDDAGNLHAVWIVAAPTHRPGPTQVDLDCTCGQRIIVDESHLDSPHLPHLP